VSTQSGMAKGEHSIFVRYKGSRSSAVADKVMYQDHSR